MELKDLRALDAQLTTEDRRLIAWKAIELFECLYVHSIGETEPRVEHATQELKALISQPDGTLTERAFHDRMIAIFMGLHDRHSHYMLPTVFQRHVAFLPIILRPARDKEEDQWVVTRVDASGGVLDSDLTAGVRVLRWNGVPCREALRARAQTMDGAHSAARLARAISTLTARPAWLLPVPDEDAVRVTYVANGVEKETEIPWRVLSIAPPPAPPSGPLGATDLLADVLHRLGEDVFRLDEKAEAERLATPETGFIRLPRFNLAPTEFVRGFAAALATQPRGGLIIDLRDNPGGIIQSGERILQLLSTRRITPTTWQFRCTPEVLDFCEFVASRPEFSELASIFEAYLLSLRRGLSDGASFSDDLPTTTEEEANDLGRQYAGPCVLVADSLTYSVGDIFASGFQDHGIGRILGTDEATGGGGSNDVAYELISMALPERFPALPQGVSFRVSLRRCFRVHGSAGVLIEGKGVKADRVHVPTIADRLNGEQDLLTDARLLLSAEEPGTHRR